MIWNRFSFSRKALSGSVAGLLSRLSGLSPVPQGLYVVTRKTGPMLQDVAAVEPDGAKIKWRLVKDAPVSGDRIELLAAGKVTLEQADKVIWAKPGSINLQYKGNVLIDQ